MKEMTQQNLINAFGGESMAHMRYLHFATQAAKEKFPNVARLFDAIAHAEYIHAGDHFKELKDLDGGMGANSGGMFGPGKTAKNLALSIAGEAFEIAEMYPVFMAVAAFQKEPGALKTFTWAYNTEQQHLKLFRRAKVAVDKGKDMRLKAVQICAVCGCTVEGDAPGKCPTCKAKADKFIAFV